MTGEELFNLLNDHIHILDSELGLRPRCVEFGDLTEAEHKWYETVAALVELRQDHSSPKEELTKIEVFNLLHRVAMSQDCPYCNKKAYSECSRHFYIPGNERSYDISDNFSPIMPKIHDERWVQAGILVANYINSVFGSTIFW